MRVKLLLICFLVEDSSLRASILSEPGLVMYGVVRNTANSNAQVISGTVTWTFTPASGSPVTVTTWLTDISGQYSYALRVPFASGAGLSSRSNESECRWLNHI